MNRDNRTRLNQQEQRRHLWLRVRLGAGELFRHPCKLIFPVTYILLVALGLRFLAQRPNYLQIGTIAPYLEQLVTGSLLCFGFIGLILLFALLGTPIHSGSAAKAFRRVGLVNSAEETPILLSAAKHPDHERLRVWTLELNGFAKDDFEGKKQQLESALNAAIVDIAEGKSKRFLCLTIAPKGYTLPTKIMWSDNLLDKRDSVLVVGQSLKGLVKWDLNALPHGLVGAMTGGGKSCEIKHLLYQCYKQGMKILVADFKGGIDFAHWHGKCKIITDKDTLLQSLKQLTGEMQRRIKILANAGCKDIEEYNRSHDNKLPRIVLAFDEVAEVLDKKGMLKPEKDFTAEIESKLFSIARLGRAPGLHLLLSTQRPDAEIIGGQLKSNLSYRICGWADDVLSRIILDNTRANDEVPKDIRGRFINHEGEVFQGFLFDESQL